jgi:hypothetical protein
MEQERRSDQRVMLARVKWRLAEERLYPLALVDAAAYQTAVSRVGVVLDELRARCSTLEDLLASADDPELLEKATAGSVPLSNADVVAAACALRSVELAAARTPGVDA